MGKLDDFLNSLSSKHKISTHADALHIAFKKCDKVYKSTLGNPDLNEMPLYIGKKGEEYLLSFGGKEAPFELSKYQILYLLSALTRVLDEDFKGNGSSLQDEVKISLDEGVVPIIGSNIITPTKETKKSPEDLKEFLERAEKAKEILDSSKGKEGEEEVEEEMSEAYQAAKRELEDFEEVYQSFTPEERNKLSQVMSEKSRDLLFEKAKSLEEELLGEIESDPSISYDYSYFKKIYTDKGAEFMREELAKIPKEERKDIINKIVEEVKQEADDKVAE